LTSSTPVFLQAESIELSKVSAVLDTRVDLAEGFDVDVVRLAATLGVTADQAQGAVTAFDDPDFDSDGFTPLLTLVARDHFLFAGLPRSLRDVAIGLPAEGEDPTLDAAVDRIDRSLLPSIVSGERFDGGDLSEQQQSDLKLLASALGGDAVTVTRTRREKYAGGRGDDEYRIATEHVPITSLGPVATSQFVGFRLGQDVRRRNAAGRLLRASADIDRSNLAAMAEEMGVSERDLSLIVGMADVLAATNRPGAGAGGLALGDGDAESFPDRGDFLEGEQGDQDYITAVERDRLEAIADDQNVVGPVGSEDEPLYQALGSVFGAQNFAFSHDIQATQAEIQNVNDPGYLGVDFPNAVTATFGYAATVVTAPAIAGFNAAFGTDIDVATVGTALSDGMWSAFGYDVDGPTIAESQAAQTLEPESFLDGMREENEERDSNEGGFNSRDSDYDNDGISDAYDNSDDSGDPSGGFDGAV
jgi:hypothetical protein